MRRGYSRPEGAAAAHVCSGPSPPAAGAPPWAAVLVAVLTIALGHLPPPRVTTHAAQPRDPARKHSTVPLRGVPDAVQDTAEPNLIGTGVT